MATFRIENSLGEVLATGFKTIAEAIAESESWGDIPMIPMTEDFDGMADAVIDESTGETLLFLTSREPVCRMFGIEPGEGFTSGLMVVGTYSADEISALDKKAEQKFYIVETDFVGSGEGDFHGVVITTKAPTTNMSGEIRLNGWLGTTNDWTSYAHGEYDSLEVAEKAVIEIFGDVREYINMDCGTIAAYKIGKFFQWGKEGTVSWLYESMREDITAQTTDSELAELLEAYESSANDEGGTLSSRAAKILEKFRDDLLEGDGWNE